MHDSPSIYNPLIFVIVCTILSLKEASTSRHLAISVGPLFSTSFVRTYATATSMEFVEASISNDSSGTISFCFLTIALRRLSGPPERPKGICISDDAIEDFASPSNALSPGLGDEVCSSEAEGLVAAPGRWMIEPEGEVLVSVGEDTGSILGAFWLRSRRELAERFLPSLSDKIKTYKQRT